MNTLLVSFSFLGRHPDERARALRCEATARIVAGLQREGLGDYAGLGATYGEAPVYFRVPSVPKALLVARSETYSLGLPSLEITRASRSDETEHVC
jgi:hypothetical protein